MLNIFFPQDFSENFNRATLQDICLISVSNNPSDFQKRLLTAKYFACLNGDSIQSKRIFKIMNAWNDALFPKQTGKFACGYFQTEQKIRGTKNIQHKEVKIVCKSE